MVSFKGKTKANEPPIADHRRIFKNGDLKIYSDVEKVMGPARRSINAEAGKIEIKPPMAATRKSAPANVIKKGVDKIDSDDVKENVKNTEKIMGKCDTIVKSKFGRKVLADVSNVGGYPLKNRLSDGSKLMMNKSERSSLLQTKTHHGKNLYGLRAQVSKSIVDGNSLSRKLVAGRIRTSLQVTKDSRAFDSVGTGGFNIYSENEKFNAQARRSISINDGKIASKPPMVIRKSVASQRVCRDSSSGELRTEISKEADRKLVTVKAKAKISEKILTKRSTSEIRTGRKTLVEISSTGNYQLRNRSSDGSKLIKNQSGERNLLPGKTQSGSGKFLHWPRKNQSGKRNLLPGKTQSGSGKFLHWPRLSSASQKLVDLNRSSRKPVGTIRKITQTSSKVRVTSKSKHVLCLEKNSISTTINPSKKKEGEVATGLICEDIAAVVSHENSQEKLPSDDNGCSSKIVTAIISRPKRSRRRSYTSLLMTRSEVLGDCTDSAKQEELPNIDDNSNYLEVAEYVDDIYRYYWIMELQNPSLANYMSIQKDLTPKMRGILINWLIEVHHKFELMQETLFLMVELFDRFLSITPIKKDEIQLVGLTALLLASKYEDFWHPRIKDLVGISLGSYTRDDMLAMEKLILKKLMFRLNAPTPYVFMLRFLKAAQSDTKVENLAFYLIELCLVEYEALKFKPSLQCASAIYVARCTLQMTPAWTELLIKHTHYEESHLRACADMIMRFHRAGGEGLLKVTHEKFLSSDRSSVAAIKAIGSLPQR